MLEKTAQIGVMQRLGGRCDVEQLRDFLIRQKRLHEFSQVLVPDLGHELLKFVPQLFNVPGSLGDKVRQIDLRFFGTPQLLENDLVPTVETVDAPPNLDEIVLTEQLGDARYGRAPTK